MDPVLIEWLTDLGAAIQQERTEARAEERAAVVARLRLYADGLGTWQVGAEWVLDVAQWIERGAHVKEGE